MRLVLGGGGLKCLTYIGTYETFIAKGIMDKVDEIYGVSAGSMMGLGMVLQIPPQEMIRIFRENYPFKKECLKMTHLISRYGLDTGDEVRRLLEKILELKGMPKNAKMTDLATKPIAFNVCVSNISTYERQLFTTKDDISIIDAVMASSTIPILFVPACIRDEYYIDGSALWHSFPAHLLKDDDIGLCQVSRVCGEEKMTFWVYLSRLMTVFSMYFSSHDTEERSSRVIYYDDVNTKLVSYEGLSDTEYEELLASGRKYGEEFYASQFNDVEKALSGEHVTTTTETG